MAKNEIKKEENKSCLSAPHIVGYGDKKTTIVEVL